MSLTRPNLRRADIWNMSMGFLGIQMGFALQNANASRILQTFGADVEHLSWFWLVAPITGMIVQPIVGHYSDNTWTRLGRRRPYFLAGAVLASLGLIFMPNAGMFAAFIPALWVGAGMLMIMDASFNIAMEPFRALVADKLPSSQRTLGFSVQTVLIGIGAVVGSWLPYVLAEWFGLGKSASAGEIPINLIISFVVGAAILIGSILWTVITTEEYTPEQLADFDEEGESIEEVSKRSVEAWEEICLDQKNKDLTLLVAHDAVNKTLICNILGIDFSNIWMIKQGNGGITIIDIFNDPKKDHVISALNITTHLGGVLDSTASGAL